MKTIAEMIPEYEANLDALRARRLELLEQRRVEPHFEMCIRDSSCSRSKSKKCCGWPALISCTPRQTAA